MKKTIVSLCLSFFVLGGFLDIAAQWNTTTIASAGKNQQSRNAQIARDLSGTLHIVFSGDRTKKRLDATYNLFYTNNFSGSFATPVQITSFGGNGISTYGTKLAVDSNGAVHILFEESDSFYYLTNSGGSFGSPVQLASGSAQAGDIAVDSNDEIHIAYSQWIGPASNDFHIFYTTTTSGSFQPPINLTASFPTYSNQSPRIALDAGDNVHLVMHSLATGGEPVFDPDLAEIFYINNIGGSFPSTTPTQITSNSGNPDGARQRNARLAIDGMGVIHIIFGTSFYNPYPTTDHKELTYMENSTGVFISTLAVYDVYDYELAVNSAGNAFIAYRDPSNNDLYVTDNRTGTFVADVVSSQSGTLEADPDLVVDGEVVHIAWNRLASPEPDVLYAYNQGRQPPTGECFVEDITMSLSYKGNGAPKNRGWTASATISLRDDQGNQVEGATVSGQWSGLTEDSDTGNRPRRDRLARLRPYQRHRRHVYIHGRCRDP